MDDRELPRGVASPEERPVTVTFDGACEGGRGGTVATYGFTVDGPGLHEEGRGLAVPPFHERATNNVAEYVGAICALEWLLAAGYAGAVVVLGDSQLVVRQMNGEYDVNAEHLRPYHERLRQLTSRFREVQFRWVPREENVRADALSKSALSEARADVARQKRAGRDPDAGEDQSAGPGG